MAELAAAASVIGVSDFALRGIKSTYDFLAGMKKAPSEVLRITEDLGALQKLLDSVVTKDSALPVVRRVAQETEVVVFIERCAKACVDLVEKLKQWMPTPEDPSLYRRFLVQTHRKDIIECRDIVRDTKATVTLAEVLVTRHIAAELLRAQGVISEQLETVFSQEVQRLTYDVAEQAKKKAQVDHMQDQKDHEEDQKEEQKEQGLAVRDGSRSNIPSEGATSADLYATTSEPGTDDMLERISEKAISLSRLAVRQDFANVVMGDENDISQKAPAFAKGAAHQSIVHVKMGSKNKVHQG